MAEHSTIEWTDATWNPVTGCSIVSPGCANCYAMKLAGTRLKHHPSRAGLTVDSKNGPVWNGKVRFNEQWLDQPLRWRRPRMIFVCAHGDLFHEDVPDEWIDRVVAVMAETWWHTYQALTKRSARMRAYFAAEDLRDRIGEIQRKAHGDNCAYTNVGIDAPWPLPNVWLGVSAERQKEADERIPDLLATPAAIRFLSAEPLLGPIDIRQWVHDYGCGCGWGGQPLDYCNECGWRGRASARIEVPEYLECAAPISDYYACPECDGHDGDGMSFGPNSRWLNWVIAGGESGDRANPMHPDWARALRDQCVAADVPFFFKQWGSHRVIYDRDVEDPDWQRCRAVTRRNPNGRWLNIAGGQGFHGDRVVYVIPSTKKKAGRVLDGMTHDGMPQPREVPAL